MIYSREYQNFIGCFYYTMIFACDVLFFFMIDIKTQSFLKIVATTVFAFAASITSIAFIIFSLPNNNLVVIVPTITKILNQNQMSQYLQWKLMNLHNQMTIDLMIGVNCAGVYTITNLTNFHTLITFCLNVILILNLFQNYYL